MGREVGTTTGRGRRCGWLDLVVLKYAPPVHMYPLPLLLVSLALHVLHHDQRLHSPQHHQARRAHWNSRNQSRCRVSFARFFRARKRVPPPHMTSLSAATKSAAQPLRPCQHLLRCLPASKWSTSLFRAGPSPLPRARCVFWREKNYFWARGAVAFVVQWIFADVRGASQERSGLRHVVSCRVKAVLCFRA